LALAEIGLRIAVPASSLVGPWEDSFWLPRLGGRPQHESPAVDLVSDATLGWRMKPLYTAPGIRHDEAGFRGVHALSGLPRRASILAIGDSFTYGLGVRDEETYGALLERAAGVEVINAGVNGYGIDQALLMWEEKGKKLNPQVVVLGYFVDDFYRNGLSVRDGPKPRFVFDAATGRHDLLTPSQSLQQAIDAETGSPVRWRLASAVGMARRKLGDRLGWVEEDRLMPLARTSRFLLARLNESVTAAGARLVVVFIGHVHAGALEHRWIERNVLRSCEDLQIKCIDLDAAMGSNRADYYDGATAHWSALGHRFAATEIARAVGIDGLRAGLDPDARVATNGPPR
jgi:hypothetical protein